MKRSDEKKLKKSDAELEDALNDFLKMAKMCEEGGVKFTLDEQNQLIRALDKMCRLMCRILSSHLERERLRKGYKKNNEQERHGAAAGRRSVGDR